MMVAGTDLRLSLVVPGPELRATIAQCARLLKRTVLAHQPAHSPSSITQLHTVYAFLPRHHDWGAYYRAEYGLGQKAKNPSIRSGGSWLLAEQQQGD
jgi:hypothetical protein